MASRICSKRPLPCIKQMQIEFNRLNDVCIYLLLEGVLVLTRFVFDVKRCVARLFDLGIKHNYGLDLQMFDCLHKAYFYV